MEEHWMMVLHSMLIGVVAFTVMIFGLKQQSFVAERRSILIASCVLIYMILFGHNLPLKLNKI
jgi:uncharacterized protein YebE (UPF0316 family)